MSQVTLKQTGGLKLYYWGMRGDATKKARRANTASSHRYLGKSIKRGSTPISTNKWLLIGATVATAAIVGLFVISTKATIEVNKLNGTASQLRNELKTKQQNIDSLKQTQEEIKQNIQKQIEDINKRVDARNGRVLPGVAVASAASISGTKADWMREAGIPEDLWGCVDALVTRESGWRVNATNASSGAYGIPQSLPGSKMASAGSDWQTNPVTQLRWMTGYVNARYGGFCQANAFQLAKHWY
jgi:hypothetical protein